MSRFPTAGLLMLVVLLPSQPISQRPAIKIPRLGQKMPCVPNPSVAYVIKSAQTAEGCELSISGIVFFFATTNGKSISYISTKDPRFKTPEGIGVGNTLADVLAAKGGLPMEEPGLLYYSKLRSGWRAAYPGIPGMPRLGASPDQSSKVTEVILVR